ncbi:MAG: hypothetical protein KFB95_08930 [Simkaniaceae bacterium]|nr:MAG: hypothetical protein KFB95_08930 [Simkaniaceae bacterium]
MKSKGIRIRDGRPDDDEILGVSPINILELLDNNNKLNWAILELEATGDLGEEKWTELEQFETSDTGTLITWDDLKETSGKFWQVIWMTIIGCKDKKNLRFYDTSFEMYESCEVVIEIFDGSCCEVFSHDRSLIERLAKKYKEIELLEPDWNSENDQA